MFFCGISSSLTLFLAEGRGLMFVTPVRIYKKTHISMFFLRKIIFRFPSKEKNHDFGKKIPPSQIIQERSYSGVILLNRPSFQNIWRKYHISMYFFWERSSFIFRPSVRSYFWEKEISLFPIIQKRLYSSANFSGYTIFSGRLEK